MKITALGFTSVGWLELDKFIQVSIGQSAIRYLDEKGITPGNVYSHIIALELLLGQKAIHRLTDATISLDHIHLSFGISCDAYDISYFMDIGGRKITNSQLTKQGETFFIYLTISLGELKQAIIANCKADKDIACREIFNRFYELLVAANLVELFENCHEQLLSDGTIIIEEG